jgi:hypothetical protein
MIISPSIYEVSLLSCTGQGNFPAYASFLSDTPAVLADTLKGTLCMGAFKVQY